MEEEEKEEGDEKTLSHLKKGRKSGWYQPC